MRMTRKGASAVALGLGVAFIATACAGGAGAAEDVPTAPAVEGAAPAGPTSLIPESGRVGAMEDWTFGATFRATQPITLDLMYRVHDGYPVQNDWLIWSALSERQNVDFNRTDVLISEWGDRRNLLIGAGEFPTLVPNVWPGGQAAWEAGGALLPISDYFDYLPNFTHWVEAWDLAEDLEGLRAENGNIYLLPILRETPAVEHTFMINVDLFEAAGAPTDFATFDDLLDAMRLVQANTDVDYVLSERWNVQDAGPLGATMNWMGPAFNTQGGWNLNNALQAATRWDADADEFVAMPLQEGYYNMVSWLANLTQEGLLDPEITQEDDMAVAKFIEGRSAMISTNFQQMDSIRADAMAQGIDLNAMMINLPAGTHQQIAGTGGGFGPGFVINANIVDSPYFLATLQFLDWILFTDEGREFTVWGVEGETFTRDADGNRWYANDIIGFGASGLNPNFDNIEITDDTPRIDREFGFQDGVWIGTHNSGSQEIAGSLMAPELRDWVDFQLANNALATVVPGAPLNDLENDIVNVVGGDILTHVLSQTSLFIGGQRPMSQWDAFMAELEAMGINQIVDIRNEALARARG